VLLEEARLLNTPERFRARFACPASDCCPFPFDRGLSFVSVPGSEESRTAHEVAEAITQMYGIRPTLLHGETPCSDAAPYATILFGSSPPLRPPNPDEATDHLVLVARSATLAGLCRQRRSLALL